MWSDSRSQAERYVMKKLLLSVWQVLVTTGITSLGYNVKGIVRACEAGASSASAPPWDGLDSKRGIWTQHFDAAI